MSTRKFSDCLVTGANISYALDEMLVNSFFLPDDVRDELKAKGWHIQPVQVIPNEDFWESVEYLTKHADAIKYLPSLQLVADAKFIGVSIRTKPNKAIIVVKMWNKDGDKATGVDNDKL